ncbi:uncharacterized protein PAC_08833 [Phialocephala subalpina]|uniref:Uncharacterized protein n=1 Tax=Phialocephala subalpina TaxID=576137 RepID=A0A1L7X1P8_9HELO|nr:uncharacterized protein PAC_08833 [Phialocephala subalpina]
MATMMLPYRAAGGALQPPPDTSRNGSHTSQEHHGNTPMRTYVINRYQTYRLGSRLWYCKVCGRRATELYHSAISFLSPFGSSSLDMVIPACKSSECSSRGFNMAHDFGKNGVSNGDTAECENCGSKSGVKLCGGCTLSHTAQSASSQGTRRQSRQRHRQSKDVETPQVETTKWTSIPSNNELAFSLTH